MLQATWVPSIKTKGSQASSFANNVVETDNSPNESVNLTRSEYQ